MKSKILKIFKNDILYIFVLSLLIGLILGFCCPREYSAKFRIFVHNIYVKFHPDIQKDSKTIIIETATKNIKPTPETNIFEEPKKENGFILIIKNFFVKNKKESNPTINDIIIK